MILKILTEMNETFVFEPETTTEVLEILKEWVESSEDGSTPLYEITLSL